MHTALKKKSFFLSLFLLISTLSLSTKTVHARYYNNNSFAQKTVTNLISNTYTELKLPDQPLQTQTMAYLNKSDLREELNYSYSDAVERIGSDFFKNLFKTILKREVDFAHNKYRVFYHGQDRVFMLFHDIYQGLYKIAYKKSLENFIMLRIRDQSFNKFKNITQFLKHYIDNGEINDWGFDHEWHIKKRLLCVNPSLFGNTSSPGECTFHYFVESQSISDLNIVKLIKNIFQHFSYQALFSRYKKTIKKLHDLLAEEERDKTGALLQIFVPEKIIDTLAYRSQAFGCLYYNDTTPQLHPASTDLNNYQKEPCNSTYSFDETQFRLLINNLTLDPTSGIKFFRYCKETENTKKYKTKLAQLLHNIEADVAKLAVA